MDKTYLDKMGKATRIQNQALAILRRLENANIPPEGWRIKQDSFRAMLDDAYYKQQGVDPDVLADYIYNKPQFLFKRKFILIDGGDMACKTANKAGFAILFRMISCDSSGLYRQGSDLIHKLNSGWVSEAEGSRIDIAENLKNQEVLFISGLSPKNFKIGEKPAYEAGAFFDEIFEHRSNYGMPTILSFNDPIRFQSDGKGSDGRCGTYICQLFEADVPDSKRIMKDEFKVLRIRVKSK